MLDGCGCCGCGAVVGEYLHAEMEGVRWEGQGAPISIFVSGLGYRHFIFKLRAGTYHEAYDKVPSGEVPVC